MIETISGMFKEICWLKDWILLMWVGYLYIKGVHRDTKIEVLKKKVKEIKIFVESSTPESEYIGRK